MFLQIRFLNIYQCKVKMRKGKWKCKHKKEPKSSFGKKNTGRSWTHMQLRAARSLWMKFLLLRYSMPRAMSVMNFTSIWDGRNCSTSQQKRHTFQSHLYQQRAVMLMLKLSSHQSEPGSDFRNPPLLHPLLLFLLGGVGFNTRLFFMSFSQILGCFKIL